MFVHIYPVKLLLDWLGVTNVNRCVTSVTQVSAHAVQKRASARSAVSLVVWLFKTGTKEINSLFNCGPQHC